MVYNIRGYWGFGLLSIAWYKKTLRELDLFPSSGEGVGDTYSVASIRKI
jgi:hypothetical protein